MIEVKGICPVYATPFTESGEVDYDSTRNMLRVMIRGGVHGLTLFGIAGEYYKLNDVESKKMINILVEEAKKGGVPSIVSITHHATEVAVLEAIHAQDAGVDCLMLLPPFFLKPGSDALYRHIHSVSNAVNIPVIVQYAPEQTGVTINPSVLIRLMNEVESIQYLKIECKPPGAYISRLIEETDHKAKIFIGNAGFQMIEGLDRGAIGVMPGCSMYDVYLKIYNSYMQGDREDAIRVHNDLLFMLNHIRQNVEMIIAFEKKILAKREIIESDYCRNPTFVTDKYYECLFEEYYEKLSVHFNSLK